ncbi:Septin-2 [Strongyloides ratti]|uniref:Septin-2 n=1 Tax=Strongyloides ratti TaxID=34506 RepID=A0A090L6F5_STRRB|nr:Septin-2 [Strongyloides ratti]CEF65317.1 Septin-2 [Strongyloides ratti]
MENLKGNNGHIKENGIKKKKSPMSRLDNLIGTLRGRKHSLCKSNCESICRSASSTSITSIAKNSLIKEISVTKRPSDFEVIEEGNNITLEDNTISNINSKSVSSPRGIPGGSIEDNNYQVNNINLSSNSKDSVFLKNMEKGGNNMKMVGNGNCCKDINNGKENVVRKEINELEDIPVLKPDGFIGIETLPYQLTKRANNLRFQFNILCVGETGIGKTTLVESLFNRKFELEPCSRDLKRVDLCVNQCEITEGTVTCKLRIVETAGYGDHMIDKDNGAKLIVNYIDEQFEKYLTEELKVKRCMMYYDDTRIHACLFFVSPTGHGLRSLDIETMKALSKRVNIIPIIAKADTTCRDELIRLKARIIEELKGNNIEIYQFPIDDDTVRQANESFNKIVPFAVIGSTDFVTRENGKQVRARKYPWGIVEVENEEHCDFVKMREALLRLNIDALREKTHEVMYENYRKERLRNMNIKDGDMGPKMREALAEHQNIKQEEMKKRQERYQKEFAEKVSKKEMELKNREDFLNMRQREFEENIYGEIKRVDEQIALLEEEKRKIKGGGYVERTGSKKSNKRA